MTREEREELRKKFDEAYNEWNFAAKQYADAAKLDDDKEVNLILQDVIGFIPVKKSDVMEIIGKHMKDLEDKVLSVCRQMIVRPSEKKVIKF